VELPDAQAVIGAEISGIDIAAYFAHDRSVWVP
jgi:hypothetical protein